MEHAKVLEIIELLDNVTLDINSVEVLLMREGSERELLNECADLWLDAYNIKKRFIAMRDSQLKNLVEP